MIRLLAALLIALASTLAAIPDVSAHPLPHVERIDERIVARPLADPTQGSGIRVPRTSGSANEPIHSDALGAQMQMTGAFYSPLTPLLIACGALLAVVSARSINIASRSRVAVNALEKAGDELRVQSLKRQIVWFNYRHVMCSSCFISLAVAGGLFALSTSGLHQDTPRFDLQATAAWGIGFLMAGLGLLCLEFLLGPITVFSNSRSIRR